MRKINFAYSVGYVTGVLVVLLMILLELHFAAEGAICAVLAYTSFKFTEFIIKK